MRPTSRSSAKVCRAASIRGAPTAITSGQGKFEGLYGQVAVSLHMGRRKEMEGTETTRRQAECWIPSRRSTRSVTRDHQLQHKVRGCLKVITAVEERRSDPNDLCLHER